MRVRSLVGVGVIIAMLGTAVGAGATTRFRTARISGPGATGWDTTPAVAWNQTANEYLVVWADERAEATRGQDIYGRRIGANGKPIGRDFRISGPQATNDEIGPAAVWNQTANEYLVVWEEYLFSQGAYVYSDIRGRRVGADGALIGTGFEVNANGSHHRHPDVAYNPATNHYLVVWQDFRNWSTSDWDIYGRRVKSNGRPAGGDVQMSGVGNGRVREKYPAVAYSDSARKFLVVWERSDGGDIYAQRVGTQGQPLGGEALVNGPKADNARKPAVACSSTNKCLVTWVDNRNSGTRGTDIYARRVRADATPIGFDSRVSGPRAAGNEGWPAVTWNRTDNQYLVVWEDDRKYATSDDDTYGRVVGSDGRAVGLDFRIGNRKPSGYQYSPSAVTWNQTANQYFVVWEDDRNEADRGLDIYGRRVSG